MSETLYTSNGGCSECDGLEGVHDQAPPRPHPKCRCQIEPLGSDLDCFELDIDCTEYTYSEPNEPLPKRFSVEWELVFELSVRCPNGQADPDTKEVRFEGTDKFDRDDWDPATFILDKQAAYNADAYLEGLTFAREHCGCPL